MAEPTEVSRRKSPSELIDWKVAIEHFDTDECPLMVCQFEQEKQNIWDVGLHHEECHQANPVFGGMSSADQEVGALQC
ncbi:hypothetical protein SLA2020_270090 [Shorea laevis]